MEDNPDYITLVATMHPTMEIGVDHSKHAKCMVAIMHWDVTTEGYVMGKCSSILNHRAARALAESWSAAKHLEIR